jgi:predicted enzyme related to lactoylglutathione lyase
VSIDVSSVDDSVKKIKEAGGTVLQPKTSIKGVGYIAYCKDTEGNIFSVMQEDTSAQ